MVVTPTDAGVTMSERGTVTGSAYARVCARCPLAFLTSVSSSFVREWDLNFPWEVAPCGLFSTRKTGEYNEQI